jgi:hypothetical protein
MDSTTSTCQPCPQNCTACNNASACTACIPNFVLSPTSQLCVPQVLCSSNCHNCTDFTSCTNCNPYYFLGPDKTCSACPSNCVSCTDSSTCKTCDAKYTLTENKTCEVQCPPLCRDCNNPGTCLTCYDGTYLDPSNMNCFVCPVNCLSCTSSSVCTSCPPSLILVAGNCVTDQSKIVCPVGCKTCLSDGSCLDCKLGFFMSNVSNTCSACSNGCLRCLNETTCTLCQGDQAPSEDGTCATFYPEGNCTFALLGISLMKTRTALAVFQTVKNVPAKVFARRVSTASLLLLTKRSVLTVLMVNVLRTASSAVTTRLAPCVSKASLRIWIELPAAPVPATV